MNVIKSPLRYPGGKTRAIKTLFKHIPYNLKEMCSPFIGGGSFELACTGLGVRVHGFDTFCPIGPWIETDLDPADVLITCSVNGQMRQMGSTRDMIFPVHSLVAFISSIMTLHPGDVILTGTPAGVGPLLAGDEVSVEIEGIGTLTNTVAADA